MVKFFKFCLSTLTLSQLILAESINLSTFNSFAKDGNVDGIKNAMKQFDNNNEKSNFVNEGDHWDKSAVHYAAEHGHADIFRVLKKDFKADINKVDYRGRTALHLAASKGYIDAVRELINQSSDISSILDKEGRNALHAAAETGQYQVIKTLLNNGNIDVDSQTGTGKTALMIASERGHIDFVNWMVGKHGASINFKDTPVGMTAMMNAAKIGHLPIVQALYSQDHESAFQVDNHGRSVFHYAASSGQSGLVDWLIKKVFTSNDKLDLIYQQDNNGVNALHLAAKYGNQNVCQLLLAFPKLMYTSDKYGQSALHHSVRLPETGFTEILEFHTPLPLGKYTCVDQILKAHSKNQEAGKADIDDIVNQADRLKNTPVTRAIEYGCSATINRLFKSGADIATKIDVGKSRNMNLLHYAIYKSQIHILDNLIRHGVSRSTKMYDGATPLVLAIKTENYGAVTRLLHYNNKEHNVLELQDTNKSPRTPIIWATIQGNVDILKSVIGNGANVNFKADKQDITALHFAAAKGDNEIVTALLKAGADFQSKDKNGVSALDTAIYYGKVNVLKSLLFKYEEAYSEDKASLTDFYKKAIDFSVMHGNDAVVKVLEDVMMNHFEALAAEGLDEFSFEYDPYAYSEDYAEFYGADSTYYNDYQGLMVGESKRRKKRHARA